MTTIIMRSWAENIGLNWSPGIAMKIDDRSVTFSELRAERVRKQRERLERIHCFDASPVRRAAHVWTFYVSHWIYHGWHLYMRTYNDRWWIREERGGNEELILKIMKLFPCGLLPIMENFYKWKEAFAADYPRGKKQGMVVVWIELGTGGHPKEVIRHVV